MPIKLTANHQIVHVIDRVVAANAHICDCHCLNEFELFCNINENTKKKTKRTTTTLGIYFLLLNRPKLYVYIIYLSKKENNNNKKKRTVLFLFTN